jgi:hypothetical protein
MPGCLPYRELDDAFGLTDTGGDTLADTRTGKNIRHLLHGSLRQSAFGRLAGYEDVNDADRLCRDPAMRWVVGDRAITGAALRPVRWAGSRRSSPRTLPLSPLCPASGSTRCISGDRPGSSCSTWIRVRARLTASRKAAPTTGISAHLLSPAVRVQSTRRCRAVRAAIRQRAQRRWLARGAGAGDCAYRGTVKRLYFRGDAAFANPEMYEFLEAEGMGYAIRLPADRVLQEKIGYLLKRPVGRPPHEVRRYYASFGYRAQSWKKPRRVVAKVE